MKILIILFVCYSQIAFASVFNEVIEKVVKVNEVSRTADEFEMRREIMRDRAIRQLQLSCNKENFPLYDPKVKKTSLDILSVEEKITPERRNFPGTYDFEFQASGVCIVEY